MYRILTLIGVVFSLCSFSQEGQKAREDGKPFQKQEVQEPGVSEGGIVYSVTEPEGTFVYLVDQAGQRRWSEIPLEDIAEKSGMAVSPDGEKVAYTAKDEKIYLMDRKGVRNRLTGKVYQYRDKGVQKRYGDKELIKESSPAWSPDGRYVAFTGLVSKDMKYAIYVTDVRTKDTAWLHVGHDPTWSMDSQHVAYGKRDGSTWNFAILESDLNGKERQITDFGKPNEMKRELSWSPKGDQIAFVVNGQIFLADTRAEKKGQERPFALSKDGSFKFTSPVWSPDGASIVFSLGDGEEDGKFAIQEVKGGRTKTIELGRNSRLMGWIKYDKAREKEAARALIEKKATDRVAFQLKEYDIDKDGKLSKEEWKEEAKEFDEWDKNGDAYLNKDELMAYFRAKISMQTEQKKD